MTTSGYASDDADARTEQKGHPMDIVDITPTPAACRSDRPPVPRAASGGGGPDRAVDALDGRTDAALAPWDRALLAAAFAALYDAEGTRVLTMREGLEALGPYAEEKPDDAA